MTKVGIITLGCKVNQYESEAIAQKCRDFGLCVGEASEVCDVYIINTCTVTAEADRKDCQMIRQCKRRNKDAYIIVCGCSSQHNKDRIAAIDGVNVVIGNLGKLECARYAYEFSKGERDRTQVIDVPSLEGAEFERMSIPSFPRTRQYIKIEDGCENKCAYCAINKSRGPIRSKSVQDVTDEALSFYRNGCREIVLTGIETASYGKDNSCSLSDLMCRLDSLLPGVCIRLGSVDPNLFRPAFLEKISPLKSAAPHFHISMQSGSSKILASMRRGYNANQAFDALERIRACMPDVMFTTDIIVGFPGETETEFEETLDFVKKARFLKVHVFPYSSRKGTEAATMPNQVSQEEKHRRVLVLSSLEAEIRSEIHSSELGNVYDVLFETKEGDEWSGHTRNFIEVRVKSDMNLHGKILKSKLTQDAGEYVNGILV